MTPGIPQRTMTFITAWLTFVPVLFVPPLVWSNMNAACVSVALLWLSATLLQRAQLNFYRSETSKADGRVEDYNRYAASGDGYRTAAWVAQAATVLAPLALWRYG